jgi:UDP-2,3-diacylglucosamine hydrolase
LANLVVLNGDIFDFRWSRLRDLETTVAAALDWLRELSNAYPKCQIHYVLGNHDCLACFREGLSALASTSARLHWHEHGLRLGNALFLHGDCTDEPMDSLALCRYRVRWENDRQRGAFAAAAYLAADRLGITRLTIARHFPRRQTVERLVHHLDQAWPDWRNTTRNCYFGHTHLPFSNYRHDGVAFHNTGSAIRGMAFNPITFEFHADDAATVLTSSRHGHAD